MSYTINNISRSTFARGLEKHLQDPLFNFGAFRVNFLRQILSEHHTMIDSGFIKKNSHHLSPEYIYQLMVEKPLGRNACSKLPLHHASVTIVKIKEIIDNESLTPYQKVGMFLDLFKDTKKILFDKNIFIEIDHQLLKNNMTKILMNESALIMETINEPIINQQPYTFILEHVNKYKQDLNLKDVLSHHFYEPKVYHVVIGNNAPLKEEKEDWKMNENFPVLNKVYNQIIKELKPEIATLFLSEVSGYWYLKKNDLNPTAMCIKYYLLSSSNDTFNKEFMVYLFESYLGLEPRTINNEFLEKEKKLKDLIDADIKVRDNQLLDMNIENINLVQKIDAEIIEKVLYRKPNLIYGNRVRKLILKNHLNELPINIVKQDTIIDSLEIKDIPDDFFQEKTFKIGGFEIV